MPIDLVKMKNKIFLLAFYEQTYDIHWKTYFKNLTFLAKENKLKEFYLILYVLESTVNKYWILLNMVFISYLQQVTLFPFYPNFVCLRAKIKEGLNALRLVRPGGDTMLGKPLRMVCS